MFTARDSRGSASRDQSWNAAPDCCVDAPVTRGYAKDMKHSSASRRTFLKHTAATTLVACAAGPAATALFSAETPARKIPIGLQLYSVRKDCEKDLVGTVTAVAKMGYKGVEFAGYYGRDAKTLRKLLDDVGLKCCGTHLQLETVLGDNLPKTIEFNQTLGNQFLIVPSLPEKRRSSLQAWRE